MNLRFNHAIATTGNAAAAAYCAGDRCVIAPAVRAILSYDIVLAVADQAAEAAANRHPHQLVGVAGTVSLAGVAAHPLA